MTVLSNVDTSATTPADTTDCLRRLQQLSHALARATTIAQVVTTILDVGTAVLQANAGAVYRFDATTQEIYAERVVGYTEETIRPYERHALSLPTPMTEAIISRKPLYIENQAEREQRFPSTRHVGATVASGAVAVLPLEADGLLLGALGLSFPTDRTFSTEDRLFFETIANLCALSLARAIQCDALQAALRAKKQAEEVTEKYRTGAELQEVLARFRSLVDNAPLAVVEWDAHYRICSWSPEAERLFGWTASEVVGKFIYEFAFVHPEDRDSVDGIMSGMSHGTRPTNIARNRNLTKDGRVLFCEWHNSSLLDDTGRLKAVLSFVVDRTAREEAETAQTRLVQAFAAQQKRMDDLLSTVPGVVWEAWGQPDAATQRINFVSDYVETMLGYTVVEWTSTPNFWLTIVHPDDKERAAATAARSWATGRQHLNTFRWMTKDGRALWCESHSVVIHDSDGNPVGMRGVTMDVSFRHAAEAALRESETRFRELADTVPQMVFARTPDGQTEYVNQRWWEYTGQTLQDIQNGSSYPVFHPDDREPFAKSWQECFEQGKPFEGEFRCQRASDGVYRWFLCRIVPIRDAGGSITRWLGTSTDIDDLKQASAEIVELNRRLRQAMTETHHRVKNNLQVIAALVELQTLSGKEMLPRSEFERLSHHIRALATVHDLLTHSAKREGQAESLRAKTVLDRLLPLLEGIMGEGKSLRATIEDAPLTSRQATSFALITNELVSNAIKHGAGDITVSFTVEQHLASLCVCDNGPGFPPGFDVKFAANTGLELVQNLASWDLQGNIAFGNSATGGGKVTITFPVSP